ncbi:hypothetical protein ACLB2K_006279 [Fragaria x ananassa]
MLDGTLAGGIEVLACFDGRKKSRSSVLSSLKSPNQIFAGWVADPGRTKAMANCTWLRAYCNWSNSQKRRREAGGERAGAWGSIEVKDGMGEPERTWVCFWPDRSR